MTVCIECGKRSKDGYWNEMDWKRLSIVIDIGNDHYERSGTACPECQRRARNHMTTPAPEPKEEK